LVEKVTKMSKLLITSFFFKEAQRIKKSASKQFTQLKLVKLPMKLKLLPLSPKLTNSLKQNWLGMKLRSKRM
jgi:hypothetical protein